MKAPCDRVRVGVGEATAPRPAGTRTFSNNRARVPMPTFLKTWTLGGAALLISLAASPAASSDRIEAVRFPQARRRPR